jgi:hypothetical protein
VRVFGRGGALAVSLHAGAAGLKVAEKAADFLARSSIELLAADIASGHFFRSRSRKKKVFFFLLRDRKKVNKLESQG